MDETTNIRYRNAVPADAAALAGLVYDSAHELLDFMFVGPDSAKAALRKLLAKPRGHFGYRFATVMLADDAIVGVELGYDRKELASQELIGTFHTFMATPLRNWSHLVGKVGRALSGYVPPPSDDAYYINNIAVDSQRRGLGLGRRLLDHVVDVAKCNGYGSIELDVTEPNHGAIRFYEKYGFRQVSESGSEKLEKEYGLPKLRRMQLVQ